jgi:hypothetical protein
VSTTVIAHTVPSSSCHIVNGIDTDAVHTLIDESLELGGGNAYANPQEYLLAALNACMIVGYTALCALQGIALQKLEITTEGDIDLRGFFGLDPAVPAGYRALSSRVVVQGDGGRATGRRCACVLSLAGRREEGYLRV